jgi:hypothetical protein
MSSYYDEDDFHFWRRTGFVRDVGTGFTIGAIVTFILLLIWKLRVYLMWAAFGFYASYQWSGTADRNRRIESAFDESKVVISGFAPSWQPKAYPQDIASLAPITYVVTNNTDFPIVSFTPRCTYFLASYRDPLNPEQKTLIFSHVGDAKLGPHQSRTYQLKLSPYEDGAISQADLKSFNCRPMNPAVDKAKAVKILDAKKI